MHSGSKFNHEHKISNEVKNLTTQVNEDKKIDAKKLKVSKVEALKADLEKASSVEAAAAEESEVTKKKLMIF